MVSGRTGDPVPRRGEWADDRVWDKWRLPALWLSEFMGRLDSPMRSTLLSPKSVITGVPEENREAGGEGGG
jgi:hypothetical protein